MSGENFECTIARAQLSSYLAGNELPEETLAALENHLKECTDCAELAEQKRAELQAALSGEGSETEIEAAEVLEEAAPVGEDELVEPSTEPSLELVEIDQVQGLNAEDALNEPLEVDAINEDVEEIQEATVELESEEVVLEDPLEPQEEVEAVPEKTEDPPETTVGKSKENSNKPETPKKSKKQARAESEEGLEVVPAAFTEEGVQAENPLLQRFKSKPFLRTLALSAALGAVLVTMAVFSKNPASIWGKKANKSLSKAADVHNTEVTPTDPKSTANGETPNNGKPIDPLRGLDRAPLKREAEGGASRLAIQSAIRTLNGQTQSAPSKPQPVVHSVKSEAKKPEPLPKPISEPKPKSKLWIAGGDEPPKPVTAKKVQIKKTHAVPPKPTVKKPTVKTRRVQSKRIIRRKTLKPGAVRVYDPSGRPFSTKKPR